MFRRLSLAAALLALAGFMPSHGLTSPVSGAKVAVVASAPSRKTAIIKKSPSAKTVIGKKHSPPATSMVRPILIYALIALAAIALVFAIIVFFVKRGRKSQASSLKFELPENLKADPLVKYLIDWRDRYYNDAKSSSSYYYVFTGIALITTSLVTAVGAVGGLVPKIDPFYALSFTTFLGFIATIATGFDRMFNDRKDFIRFGRYSRLLELAIIKYIAASSQSSGAASSAEVVRKAFVDESCKILADELSDWIQDETSAVVNFGTSPQVLQAQTLGSAQAALGAAQLHLAAGQANLDAATKARDEANAAVEAIQPKHGQASAHGDKAALDSAIARHKEQQKNFDAAMEAMNSLQEAVDAKQREVSALSDAGQAADKTS